MKQIYCLLIAWLSSACLYAQTNAMEIKDYSIFVALKGTTAQMPVLVSNVGSADIRNIDYVITCPETGETKEYHYDIPASLICIPQGAKSTMLNLPATAGTETRIQANELKIVKVNGLPNEADEDKATSKGRIITVAQPSQHRVLMEEFTATWCINCPRGIVAMRKLQNLFQDRFIGIAIHLDDIMSCSGYNALIKKVEGVPYSMVDRWRDGDPYWGQEYGGFGMKDIVETCLNQQAEASVEISELNWSDDLQQIDIATDVIFQYNRDEAPYALGYAVVEDSLTGTTKDWWQKNNLMDDLEFSFDDDFKEFYKGERIIKDMVYNHVAMGGWRTSKGYDESIQAPLVAGAKQTHRQSLNLSAITTIQNKKNLKVVAMLIDRENNRIVNTAQMEAGSLIPTTAIGHSVADNAEVHVTGIYSITGVKLNKVPSGVYIVKYSDGTTVKKVNK